MALKTNTFSPYLLFVIKVASYLIIVMCHILTILSHLDMGLFDSQNAKEMCFSLVYLLPIHLYAAQVDVLREQAIQNYRAGQTQQAVSQLDQLLNKYPHDQKLLADYLFIMSSEKDLTNFHGFGKY